LRCRFGTGVNDLHVSTFLARLRTALTIVMMRNSQNRILAISAAPAARPPKPNTADMIATMKKMSEYLSMAYAFWAEHPGWRECMSVAFAAEPEEPEDSEQADDHECRARH
jgi:hypothetical protein